MPTYDGILLIGFGGPTRNCCRSVDPCPGEAHCFVSGILGNRSTAADRVAEVAGHYVSFGGFSQYNEVTYKQAGALELKLAERGLSLPVSAGFRHWEPQLKYVIEEMNKRGQRKTLGIIMAPHQSKVSWDWYQDVVEQAIEERCSDDHGIDYLEPFFSQPKFIESISERIRETTGNLDEETFNESAMIFTAHSIPEALARIAPYSSQIEETARLVANGLGHPEFEIAYQSSPGEGAEIPWIGPDICDLLPDIKEKGYKDVIVTPIGFLCENMEVLFDIGVEARDCAAELDLNYHRPSTVGVQPRFIELLTDLVEEKISA